MAGNLRAARLKPSASSPLTHPVGLRRLLVEWRELESQASSAFSNVARGTERSTITLLGSRPSGSFSPPVPVMKRAPSAKPPSAATTVRTGTPLQMTQPAAPTCHLVPLGLPAK